MKILRWFIVALFILGLILVRKFQTELFYDPLLEYFHQDFLNIDFPHIDVAKHFGSIALRYFINSLLSLGIIWFIFLDKKVVKFSAIILAFFFFIFLAPYYYFIATEFSQFYTAGFYVRRLLIQPVMLLILIPAIWYWKNQKLVKSA
ncbi:exosortase F system-associated protein [Flavobacteriaceae bacterium Ap0902]|nr:exosortase F system-associated protein [Flavobacteriaceae bacterium Ap0902]